ncbi:MAG: primosomal protein N', partial [Clostridia bacterium]|nr:primosomal protein N' [Clostridia bacterium]
AGERFDMYRKIKNGDADLVIGTRSAVFAPLPRLKLIIIDEEHEHTYKSEQNPRYHTRDVAAWRSGYHNALTVLASAPPSVEVFYRAKTGKYTLVPLTERYGGALLPQTQIADMREEYKSGNLSPFSRLMTERLEDAKAQGKQAILFLNRRGYHHAVSCKNCGAALECPHCSVALTYHTDWKSGYLLCHACGYKTFMPKTCPGCQSEHLSFVGFGTQKAEADLSSLSDKFRVIRMDADTTSSKTAYDRLLSRFRQGDADVLLGTQMVTKGHDFPNVTLSGVLSADTSLYANDFRAAERTFSLLTQVIGRAGRAASPGTAVIQTFSPDNQVIRLAAKQDYEAFYEAEIALRRSLGNPPFSDIAEVLLSASDENQLMKASLFAKEKIIALFREQAPDSRMELYGPLEPATYRIAGKCRLKISCKCRLASSIRHLFGEVLLLLGEAFPKVSASVDFNPLSV